MTILRGVGRLWPRRNRANGGGGGPPGAALVTQGGGAPLGGVVPATGGQQGGDPPPDGRPGQPVSLDVANPVNLRIQADQGASLPAPVQPADLQKMVQAVGNEARKLAKSLRRGVRLWPGALLSFIGVAQLLAAFLIEALAEKTLGAVEFVTASVVGLAMALAGPLVIAHNANKSDELAKEAIARAAADKRVATYLGDD